MGPTIETRSRDEWLAEVKRRGGRLRRRRRVGFASVAALAMVLPVSLTAAALRTGPERAVELSVAGPAPVPTDGATGTPSTSPVDEPVADGSAATTDEAPPLAGAPSPTTTTTEVHRRVATVRDPVVEPTPRTVPASVPPADDPVVASPPTTLALAPTSTVPVSSATGTTLSTTGTQSRPMCLGSEFGFRVGTDKSAYATGEPVKVVATVEKRTATACRLPSQVHVRIDNSAGQNVVAFPYTIDIVVPDNAEPGMTFTGSYTWDQRDCVNASCAQAPAGTYVVYGEAPMSDRVSFKVDP